jgi:dipeptidyl aminopeptidase/acylaminoacyl peptidase
MIVRPGAVATAHFVSPQGKDVRSPVPIPDVGHPMTTAWSPDGRHVALVNLPGRGYSEVWILDVAAAKLRRALRLPAPHEIDGVAWAADGRSLVTGRIEFETEVLLMEGLPGRKR